MIEQCLSCKKYSFCYSVEVLCDNLSTLEDYEEDLGTLKFNVGYIEEG